MSLTNPNTPVSQQDLQDFYHKLLPYMGGSFGLVATGIDSANLYSTTERVVGQWIDGKPLYQKTFEFTVPTTYNSDVTIYTGNTNERIKYAWGALVTSTEDSVTLDSPYNGTARTALHWNKNVLTCRISEWGGSNAYVTIQYTKTTDSAVESYGTDTTYSTDEHVVGSWIDGRPVYQKTIYNTNLGSISNSAWTNYATITNCKCIIDSVFMRALADGTPSGVFNDIAASVGTSNNIRVISRTTTLTLDDSKSYLTLRYTKSS